MRIGVLTGGGDCPGLNAVIRAIYKRAVPNGHELVGFMYGWRGVIDNTTMALDEDHVRDILHVGGTILRTSGDNPFHTEDGPTRVIDTLERNDVDALIVIGGEGTMMGAARMWAEHRVPVVGVPKTIDNDLPGTDVTFGFDSALAVATDALDRLHTTAESHTRVMVCEVMGRTAGWLALYSGIAGGANVILIPEINTPIEDAAALIMERSKVGKIASLVVVGEGYTLTSTSGQFDNVAKEQPLDAYGFPKLGGVSHHVAEALTRLTGFETRVTILGHVQRGGSPTPHDRVLASRFGALAAELCLEGDFGKLVAMRGGRVQPVDIEVALGPARVVPEELYSLLHTFNG